MTTTSLIGILAGLAFGIRHALEPDHITAVAVLAAESPNQKRNMWLGVFWGIGHTLALLAVGLLLAAFSTTLPERLSDSFELAVAVMLVVLGARALARAATITRLGPPFTHHHGSEQHDHPGPADHVHVGRLALATKPLLVGTVHGLAGSGALTALVLADLPEVTARLAFITLFGVGSIVGMGALAGFAGLPLAHLVRRPLAGRVVLASAGMLSTCVGIGWGAPLVQKLFLI